METGTNFTRIVPVVAVRGSVIFPHTDSILTFGRPKSVAAVNASFQEDRVVAIFGQKDPRVKNPDFDDLHKIGTIATITQMMSTDGEIYAMVRGHARIKLEEGIAREPYLSARITEIAEENKDSDEVKALANKLSELFQKSVNLGKSAEITTVMKIISGQVEPVELVDSVASLLEIKQTEKQQLLENFSVKERLEKVIEFLNREVNVLDIERTISIKTQKRFEDQMRKAMLREKRRTIDEELGEEDGASSDDEIGDYKAKVKKAKMPKEVAKKAKKEVKRL
ncbi:MAG: ATP-dependent protease La, ATP-dependent Lon protease, partial [Candidatus Woesebacteria bacterium GW2011_GWC1_43_10b]